MAVLEAQLAEAEAALHKLMLGERVVKIDYDGAGTEFNRASEDRLRRYIADLKRQLGRSVGPGSRRVVF